MPTRRRPSPRRGDIVEPALLATYALSGGHRTPNDGLIPVEDCIRGRWLGCISTDHWDQVGHAFGLTDAFDHVSFITNTPHFWFNRDIEFDDAANASVASGC